MARDKQFKWSTTGFGITPELVEMTRQLPVTLLEYSQTLWALQFDTTASMVSEMTRQLKYWLNSAAYSGDALSRRPGVYQPGMQKFGEISRGWFDAAAQASVEMNQLLWQALSASRALTGESLATYPGQERRKLAQVIPFADRRRSLGQSRMVAGAGETNDSHNAVKAKRSSRRRGSSG